jgi:hypothetical protein
MCKSRIVFFFTFKDYRGHLNTRYFNFEGGCARTHRTPLDPPLDLNEVKLSELEIWSLQISSFQRNSSS